MLDPSFVLIGILINAVGTVYYLKETIKGKIKPNRVTFFIWSIAPLIVFAAQISQGVGIQSLLALSVGLFPLSIFIATFLNKKAYWKLNLFDFSFGFLALIGLILWQITKVGNIAISFSILAEGLATLPTIVKSFNYPETESAWPWFASFTAGTLTLLTIKEWNFASYGFPLFYTAEMLIIFILVQLKIGKKLALVR